MELRVFDVWSLIHFLYGTTVAAWLWESLSHISRMYVLYKIEDKRPSVKRPYMRGT